MALVEYSKVIFTLMLIIMGVIDGGLMFWNYIAFSRAVTMTARCAAVDPKGTDNVYPSICPDYVAFAKSQSLGIDISSVKYDISYPSCGKVLVSATYTFHPTLAPFNLPQQIESASFTQQQDQGC